MKPLSNQYYFFLVMLPAGARSSVAHFFDGICGLISWIHPWVPLSLGGLARETTHDVLLFF
jgi:hypothetical protein